MQYPLTVGSCTPTQLAGPPALPCPGRVQVLQRKTERAAGRGSTGWEARLREEADTDGQTVQGEGHCKGVLSRGDKYKSWATGPQRLPPQKEHILTLHLLGTASQATLPLCQGPARAPPAKAG